jgi:hypothetical protein
VTVTQAWVGPTLPKMNAAGVYMKLTSTKDVSLVRADSPAAGIVEIHEMKMEGDTMRMRAIAALDLPAGKAVDLKPGGYHVMLMDLKQQVKPGDTVAVTLVIEGAGGKRESVEVKAPVRPLGGKDDHSGHHGHKH